MLYQSSASLRLIFRVHKLLIATTVNCFPSRVYGQMEYYLSCLKALTIVLIGKLRSQIPPEPMLTQTISITWAPY